MKYNHLLLLATLIFYISPDAVAAQEIPATYPKMVPKLIINKDPEFCAIIKGIAEEAYYSDDPYPKIIDISYRHINELPTFDKWNGMDTVKFQRIQYKTNKGVQENWVVPLKGQNSENYYLSVYSSVFSGHDAQQYSILQLENTPQIIKRPEKLSFYREEPQLSKEDISTNIEFMMSYSYIVPVIYKSNYYLIFGNLYTSDVVEPLTVVKISSEINSNQYNELSKSRYKYLEDKTICKTEAVPHIRRNNERASYYNNLNEEIGSLGELLKYSGRLVGSDQPSAATAKLLQAIYRPWTINTDLINYTRQDSLHYKHSEGILNTWKYLGPWEFTQYSNFKKYYERVRSQLSSYYQAQLGWDRSKSISIANNSMQQFMRTLIGTGDYIQSSIEEYKKFHSPAWKLRKLLLDNPQEPELNKIFNSGEDLDLEAANKQSLSVYEPSYEQAIFYTLNERGRGLTRLIGLGVNVNAVNHYGKTPLMVAAHLNNISATRELIMAGADVNATTFRSKRRGLQINYSGRTALMYAAENASYRVIELLVEAGADIQAIDSRKRTIADYLQMNEIMSTKDIDKTKELLE